MLTQQSQTESSSFLKKYALDPLTIPVGMLVENFLKGVMLDVTMIENLLQLRMIYLVVKKFKLHYGTK